MLSDTIATTSRPSVKGSGMCRASGAPCQGLGLELPLQQMLEENPDLHEEALRQRVFGQHRSTWRKNWRAGVMRQFERRHAETDVTGVSIWRRWTTVRASICVLAEELTGIQARSLQSVQQSAGNRQARGDAGHHAGQVRTEATSRRSTAGRGRMQYQRTS